MSGANSPLVSYTLLSPNHSGTRKYAIDTITIHCFVAQVSAKRGCQVFASKSRNASCNYVVGYDGKIGLCVEEKNRSWCTSSATNDHRAITIEVASDTKAPYKVTDKAYAALIDLVTDICKRNNIKSLKWAANKSMIGQLDVQNMTVHKWFANKACPGDYLYNKHDEIAAEVNKRLGVGFTPYKVKVTNPPVNIRKEPNANGKIVGKITSEGVYTIVEESKPNGTTYPWGKLKSGAGWITLSPSFVKKV